MRLAGVFACAFFVATVSVASVARAATNALLNCAGLATTAANAGAEPIAAGTRNAFELDGFSFDVGHPVSSPYRAAVTGSSQSLIVDMGDNRAINVFLREVVTGQHLNSCTLSLRSLDENQRQTILATYTFQNVTVSNVLYVDNLGTNPKPFPIVEVTFTYANFMSSFPAQNQGLRPTTTTTNFNLNRLASPKP
jgi:type VI protein secretion system component Hcp